MSANELIVVGEKYLLGLNYGQAIVYFDRAIEIEPMAHRSYTGLAEAYVGIGEPFKAIDTLNKGLGILPDSPEITTLFDKTVSGQFKLGEQMLIDLDYNKAVGHFTTLVSILPLNARGYTGCAEAYIGQGNSEKAIEILKKGLEQMPNEKTISEMLDKINNVADVYYKYIEEQLAPEYKIPSLGKAEGTMYTSEDSWLSLTGILAAYISDLDQDGSKDLLLFYTKETGQAYPYSGTSASSYQVYAAAFVLKNSAPIKADEIPLTAYHETNDEYLNSVSLTSNQSNQDNLFISSINANNKKYIMVEYSSAAGYFADGYYCGYWALEFDNGKISTPFSFLQSGPASADFQYIGYEVKDNKIQSKELLYSTAYYGIEEPGIYSSFEEALSAFWNRFGISASFKDRDTSMLNDEIVDQRIFSYSVKGIDSGLNLSGYKYVFEATDYTDLRKKIGTNIISPQTPDEDPQYSKVPEDENSISEGSSLNIQNSDKDKYMGSLSYIDALEKAYYSDSTGQMETSRSLGELYRAWDYELNRIYGLLKEKLPSSEMDYLKIKQREWIAIRDKNAADARMRAEGADDSWINTLGMISMMEDTKKRALELIDIYYNEYIGLYDTLLAEWQSAANRYINNTGTMNEIFDFGFYSNSPSSFKTYHSFYDIDDNGITELLLKKQNGHGEDIIAYIFSIKGGEPVNLFGYNDGGLPYEVPWSRVGSCKILDNGLIDCGDGNYTIYKIADNGYSVKELASTEPYGYPDEANKAKAKWRNYINGEEVGYDFYVQFLEQNGYTINRDNILADISWISDR
ncbi:MAG: tetratricopeptide repeat protein [Clostridiales bacterium]|nr:tetratricopeptide repeat protein [Clostridiales bacterium]